MWNLNDTHRTHLCPSSKNRRSNSLGMEENPVATVKTSSLSEDGGSV